MKIVGIVAEYNPFHNGHKYQLDYARNVLGADCIIVAMSGSFTQRGSIACYDKYTRAQAALLNGADVILEIPTIFATSSASEYASAAVQLLASTGIVDTILFGAETDDSSLFIKCAKELNTLKQSEDFQDKVYKLLSQGKTHAQAIAEITNEYIYPEISSSPNNILGLEYSKYILEHNLSINIACCKRIENNYHDSQINGEISSATSIRNAIKEGNNYDLAIPENVISLYKNSISIDENDISLLLHQRLIQEKDFCKYLDCSSDISDRINKIKNDFISYSQFCLLLKTKNITYTRASRVLCHILLGITQDDFEQSKKDGYINYLRLLGFSKNGSSILSEIKTKCNLPIITKVNDAISSYDIFSSDIVRIIQTNKSNTTIPNEYTRKFDLVNI